ncbi:MAG TPA: hypothetical protein VGV40_13170 [Solirubrobacteraceae bacterium]|nr:hypothetical protein [Solirubrobacteraceae bacterium]
MAAIVALVFIAVNTLTSVGGVGPRGLGAGTPLPAFAVPLVLSSLEGDANVNPGPGAGVDGERPACAVRGPRVLTVCPREARAPLVLAFLATRGADCTGVLERMETARADFPGVGFAAVAIRGEREALRDLVRKRGWSFPVGLDRDGVLATLYGVAVCPYVTFATPDGVVRATTVGNLDQAAFEQRVTRLVDRARSQGWEPPR